MINDNNTENNVKNSKKSSKKSMIKPDKKINRFAFILGNKTFSSKTDAKMFISQFIKSHDLIPVDDQSWVTELFKLHPRYKEKSINLKEITIKFHLGNNHFALIYKDGKSDDFSYKKCLENRSDHHKMTDAMRYYVIDQIYNYKNSQFLSNPQQLCKNCNKALENDFSTHVDHVIFFRNIVRKFCEIYHDIKTIPGKMARNFADEKLVPIWKEFHNKYAIYQLLCAECNMKRLVVDQSF